MGILSRMLAALTILVGSPAYAVIILTSVSADDVPRGFEFSGASWEAIGIVTGPTYRYRLDSVSMRLSGATPGEVAVSIYDDATEQFCDTCREKHVPGDVIAELRSQVVLEKGDYSFMRQGAVMLAPDTLYWIVFRATGTEIFRYYEQGLIEDFDPPGEGYPWQHMYLSETGARVYDFATSPGLEGRVIDGVFTPGVLGTDWSYHSGLNIFEIQGHLLPVPEPSTLSLLLSCLGPAAAIAVRRRFRRGSLATTAVWSDDAAGSCRS